MLDDLHSRESIPQRTPQWFEARRTMLTATNVASVLTRSETVCKPYHEAFPSAVGDYPADYKSCDPMRTQEDMMLSKAGLKPFIGNFATRWGTTFEPIACEIYSRMNNVKVHEFGLLRHQKYDFLGASPDGVTEDGIMVEFKCPVSRPLKPAPPMYYWTQCQMQMEVCDRDKCDYCECKFQAFLDDESFLNHPTIKENKGVFIRRRDSSVLYPDDLLMAGQEALDWANAHAKEGTAVFWYLEKLNCVRIERDREWFASILPYLYNAHERLVNFKPPEQPQEDAEVVDLDSVIFSK